MKKIFKKKNYLKIPKKEGTFEILNILMKYKTARFNISFLILSLNLPD